MTRDQANTSNRPAGTSVASLSTWPNAYPIALPVVLSDHLHPPPEPPSPKHWPCERCQTWILPVKPPFKYRVWEILFWISVPIALFFLKGAGVVAMPLILMFVGGLAGPLHELATREARCPTCHCYLPAKRVLVLRNPD